MNRTRTWSLGAAVVAVLVLVAGWFLLISPAKAKIGDLNSQTTAQEQTNQGLGTQIAQLKIQRKGLPEQAAKLALIRQHLPSTPALPSFIQTLTLIAHNGGVKLVTITPGAPVPGPVPAAPVVATPTPSASASTGSATDETAVTPTAQVPTSPLRMIPVTLTISGGYYNVVSFLSKVENLQRSMIVYGVNLTPGATGPVSSASPSASTGTTKGKITALVTARIFYSPVVVTATTPATGAAPAASGAAAPAAAS
jgi:Tfp pilus assembly protein PilO